MEGGKVGKGGIEGGKVAEEVGFVEGWGWCGELEIGIGF